jgi:hypothetical protein
MDLYFDWHGKPIDRDEYARLWQLPHHVALTDLLRRGRVSTIWFGLDLGFPPAPPLIFETMVFGGPLDGFLDRYPTEALARAGHGRVVRLLRRVQLRPLIHNGGRPKAGGSCRFSRHHV